MARRRKSKERACTRCGESFKPRGRQRVCSACKGRKTRPAKKPEPPPEPEKTEKSEATEASEQEQQTSNAEESRAGLLRMRRRVIAMVMMGGEQ